MGGGSDGGVERDRDTSGGLSVVEKWLRRGGEGIEVVDMGLFIKEILRRCSPRKRGV